MKSKKNNTPSCIYDYMNKININCVNVPILTIPVIPNCNGHH